MKKNILNKIKNSAEIQLNLFSAVDLNILIFPFTANSRYNRRNGPISWSVISLNMSDL